MKNSFIQQLINFWAALTYSVVTVVYLFMNPITAFGQQIEEVVVTVERREVDLQDYGGTAVSFTGDELKLQGIQDMTDLSESVVGLEIGNNRGNVEVWIRGVGSDNNTELGDPAAATHIDGIYIPRPRGIGGAFFDLERVEVNVGPQGTLRGRNAMAGSVNAIPWRPGLGVWNAAFETEIGNYNQRVVQAVLNAPMGEYMATRLSLIKKDHDSYYNDVSPTNREGPEAADDFAGRLQFLFKPIDRLSILLAGDYLSEQGTGYTGTNFANPLGDAGLVPDDIDDPRDVWARGITPIQDTVHWGLKFQIDYQFDNSTIEFNYGRRDLYYDYQASTPLSPDYPGVVESLGGTNIEEALDDFSRFQDVTDSVSDIFELRYYTSPENDVYFTTGVFYFLEDQSTFLGATGDGETFFQGIEFNQPNTDTESIAIFGDATWNISDQTRFTFGLRWTDETKSRQGVNASYRVGGQGIDRVSGDPADGLGFRFGTEGFEFAIDERTIFDPDTDNDGLISDVEYYEFILNGVKTFGARDNFDEVLLNSIAGNPTTCLDTRLDDEIDCPSPPGSDFLAIFPFGVLTSVAPQQGSVETSFIDWRIRIEQNFGEDSLAYLLIATGHKSGGFNDTFAVPFFTNPLTGELEPTTNPAVAEEVRFQNGVGGESNTYEPERVTNYELGFKNELEFAGIPTRFNGSFFYQDYVKQVFCNVLNVESILAGAINSTNNAGSSTLGVNFCFNTKRTEIYGSQFEGAFFFPREFTFKWSALWLESAFKDGPVLVSDSRFQRDINPEEAVEVDIAGNRLPRSPQFSLNVSLSQNVDLPFGTLDYILSAAWRGEQHLTIFNGIDYQQPNNPRTRLDDIVDPYWTFDLGAGLDFGDTNFRIESYINNITDYVRPTALLLTESDNTRFFTRPRTYGFRLKWQL